MMIRILLSAAVLSIAAKTYADDGHDHHDHAAPALKSINLRLEMKEFSDDLKRSRSYSDEALEKALKAFKGTQPAPANANAAIEKMAVALAEVDKEFRSGWTPFKAGKYEDAVGVWKEQ